MTALPPLPHFKPSPTLNPRSSRTPLRPNTNAFFLTLRRARPHSSLGLGGSRQRAGTMWCSAVTQGDCEPERVAYPRPQEVPWSRELANSVHLIGVVGAPVQMKRLASGKALAWTRLAVKKSASDTTWINLTFWDELAHVAFQHVEKGHRIYVLGRLISDTVEGEDDKQRQVYYKVVVQQLNFIERSFPPPVSLYEPDGDFMTSGTKLGDYIGRSNASIEELWQAFFANPVDWWDNRKNKRNPKYPDFKHKHTGEALWIEGKYNPPWVKSQLAILDTRMTSLQDIGTSPAGSYLYGDDFTPF